MKSYAIKGEGGYWDDIAFMYGTLPILYKHRDQAERECSNGDKIVEIEWEEIEK